MAETEATSTSIQGPGRSRGWGLGLGRFHRRPGSHDQDNNFPKSPMQPSHLSSIPAPNEGGENRDSLTVPERAIISDGPPAPGRLNVPRPSSDLIEAEIRRVTSPLPPSSSATSRRGSAGSGINPPGANPASNGMADLSAELQKMKKRKVWWWQRDDILKARMSTAVVAAIMLLIVVVLYLALYFADRLSVREIHFVLIMLVVLVTLFFVHSVARLLFATFRTPQLSSRSTSPNQLDIESQNAATINVTFYRGPGGYAIPAEPIPIVLPDDGKAPAAGTTIPPPAYGLWRSSVRVDPNQFYWVRRTSEVPPAEESTEEREADNRTPPPPPSPTPGPLPAQCSVYRPPSYISEDGVSYVLAGPRPASTALLSGSAGSQQQSVESIRRGSIDSTRSRQAQTPRSSVDGTRPHPQHDTSPPRNSIDSRRSRAVQEGSPSRGSIDGRRQRSQNETSPSRGTPDLRRLA